MCVSGLWGLCIRPVAAPPQTGLQGPQYGIHAHRSLAFSMVTLTLDRLRNEQ